MRLTPHFRLSELTYSDTAVSLGNKNIPTKEHLANLQELAKTLERVRKVLGNNAIIISSGYRNPEVNKAVGGSPTSDHANGLAADFSCPGYGSVQMVCEAIRDSGIKFDQLIFEQRGSTHWAHLGIGRRMRQQALSWSPSQGYVNGVVHLGGRQ